LSLILGIYLNYKLNRKKQQISKSCEKQKLFKVRMFTLTVKVVHSGCRLSTEYCDQHLITY